MTPDLDDIRARFPHLGVAVYAYAPGGPVTLEILDDAKSHTIEAPSLAIALARAFPAPQEHEGPENPQPDPFG